MKVLRARDMGFCWGVKRAVDILERTAERGVPVTSLGSVVHNPQVVEQLKGRGVDVASSLEQLNGNPVAITAHGVGPEVLSSLRQRGLEVIDTTCPIVTRSQRWAKKVAEQGYTVIIFGDADHKEVRGVLGWTAGRGIAITEEGIDSLPETLSSRLAVLAQTTQNPQRFARFVSLLLERRVDRISELQVINTLCNATSNQQAAAEELADQVEMMVVVGGRESANTRHLVEVCAQRGVETHHVETAEELQARWFLKREAVGVTAGASTPDFVIDEVVRRIEELAPNGDA